MKLFRTIKNWLTIPYIRTLLVILDDGTELYCKRWVHTDFQSNNRKDWWDNPKRRGGKFVRIDGIWNEYPDDTMGYIPYSNIKKYYVLKTKEDFDKYKEYQLKYFKEHPVELYLPECRDELTKEFLEWLNTDRVQLMIRNWVDGYGYSDAYNWENPDILIEHIYKEAAIKYGGEEVLKKLQKPFDKKG